MTSILLVVLVAGIPSAAGAAGGGVVEGTISIATGGGETIPGDWVRILMVREAVAVPKSPPYDPSAAGTPAVREQINRAHMAFFKSVQQRLSDPNYLIESTLSTSSGTFKFVALPAGRYFVVVTFPSLIGDYKVAWQVPVSVKEGATVHLRLDRRNMALPSYSRDGSMEVQ